MDHSTSAELTDHYPALSSVTVRDRSIAGRHGPVPARVYSGSAQGLQPGLAWFHGGGFISGDLDMPESNWVGLSIAANGFVVVTGDYTKCTGGTHYPIPNDDVLDLWTWVVENATGLGVDPSRIHLGGASAGAALAATLSHRLRDGAGPLPQSIVLAYPMLHRELDEPRGRLRELLQEEAGFVITPEIARSISANYTGDRDIDDDPYVFAAEGDPSGLPPTYILNSEIDSLRISGEEYGAALSRTGVEVLVESEPGALHGHLNEPFKAPGERSLARLDSWLRSHSSCGSSN